MKKYIAKRSEFLTTVQSLWQTLLQSLRQFVTSILFGIVTVHVLFLIHFLHFRLLTQLITLEKLYYKLEKNETGWKHRAVLD